MSEIINFLFFLFFQKTTCPSVEIIFFCSNSLSNGLIDLKIGLNVREGVVHVRKAQYFKILIASCKFMQIKKFVCTVLTDLLTDSKS